MGVQVWQSGDGGAPLRYSVCAVVPADWASVRDSCAAGFLTNPSSQLPTGALGLCGDKGHRSAALGAGVLLPT